MSISDLFSRLRSYWQTLLAIHLAFTILGVTLLAPLFGLLLQGTLALSGSAAVVDQDIARLLLSPTGAIGAVLLTALLLALTGLELAALQVIAQAGLTGRRIAARDALRYAFSNALPILRLTLGLTLRVLAYLLPYLAIVAGMAWWFLKAHDINYYLAERPPEFLAVAAVAAAFGLVVAWLLGRRLLDWCLVLPLLLFRLLPAGETFAASAALVRGNHLLCLRALATWLLLALVLLAVPTVLLKLGMLSVVGSGSTQLATLALMLGLLGAAWSALNFLVAAFNLAGLTFVVADLYRQLAPGPGAEQLADGMTAARESGTWLRPRNVALAVSVLGLAAVASVLLMLSGINLEDRVLVIAHRGAAGSAPENTLASVRQAIADGTDWVEIDVQESRDGQVVVVHDSDFMKLAKDPLKVWEGDLERIRQIDVGSWFNPRFADQRVPTLAEVLDEIKRSEAGLVIELKYYGHDQQLEQRVVDLVEAAGIADRVVVMSLKLEGVHKLKRLRPQWTGGLLAATAVGDITRLDADFLAVNQSLASAAFIRRAHKAGKRVFVWTVNDALSLSHWMSSGVDGVITDEPALARSVLAQREQLSSPERLLLSAAMFFGKPEALRQYRDNSP